MVAYEPIIVRHAENIVVGCGLIVTANRTMGVTGSQRLDVELFFFYDKPSLSLSQSQLYISPL